ncbi:MAG: hypothetical protein LBJ24_06560 [Treponema sp.]|jgi:zinc transport system permease protein|nr:hypothetical protein [Treponema sp.]
MMLAGCVLSGLFSAADLFLGWVLDLPVGAVTVIAAGIVFLAVSACTVFAGKRKAPLPRMSGPGAEAPGRR